VNPPSGVIRDAAQFRGDGSTDETPTATASGFEYGPDRETPVLLRNRSDRRAEMRLQLVCAASSDSVYERTYTLEPGDRLHPLDLTAVTVAGRGAVVAVRVTAREQTRSATVETTDFGEVHVELSGEGAPDVWASAC
jgi:hypothetical protein